MYHSLAAAESAEGRLLLVEDGDVPERSTDMENGRQ